MMMKRKTKNPRSISKQNPSLICLIWYATEHKWHNNRLSVDSVYRRLFVHKSTQWQTNAINEQDKKGPPSPIEHLQLVSWLITRFRNRVPGCWNRVTRIWLLGLDTKYLVKYYQKAMLVLQNKFCDCKKIIFTKLFCDSNK